MAKKVAKAKTKKKTSQKKGVKSASSKTKKAAAKKTTAKTKSIKKKAAIKSAAKKTLAKKSTTLKHKKSSQKKGAKKSTTMKKKIIKSKSAAGHEVEVLSPSKKIKKIKGYSKKQLDEFKKIILEKRNEIIEQLQSLKDQMMDPTTGQYVNENSPYSLHMAEQGTDAMEREKLYLWAQRENKFLAYLDDALQRIENGSYGICIDCIDEPQGLCPTCPLIPKERLCAVPHTQHCLQVKQKMQGN